MQSRRQRPSSNSVVPTLTDVDDLKIGRAISFPVHDKNGLLLLAAGSSITPEFKRLLRLRDINSVVLHPQDFASVVQAEVDQSGNNKPRFDSDVSRQLDATIDRGMLFANNSGSRLQELRVLHGAQSYDLQLKDDVRASQLDAIKTLSKLLAKAIVGESFDATPLVNIAETFSQHLVEDMDLVISMWVDGNLHKGLVGHCLQMSILAMAIAVEMGLSAENVERVGVAALVHDWGMMRVPEAIRLAPRSLKWQEQFEVKKHPIHTINMLQRIYGLPSTVLLTAYQVHEKLDGTGYPRGRKQGNIFLFARILNVADEYVALTSERPQRKASSPYNAISDMLNQNDGRASDPVVLRALLRVLSIFPVGSDVSLTDGSLARVIRSNGDNYMSPVVQRIEDADRRDVSSSVPPQLIDLTISKLSITTAILHARHELSPPHFQMQHVEQEAAELV